MAATEEESQKG